MTNSKAKQLCECCGEERRDVECYPNGYPGTDFCNLCEECKEAIE